MIDQNLLKQLGQDLAKRGGGDPSERWIQVSKIKEPIDIRIMDPLPSMKGIYFLEVQSWWIDGKKIYSPSITFKDKTEDDIISKYIKIAEKDAKTDKTLAKLLSAKSEKTGMPVIQLKYEYWVPVLKFTWDDRDVPMIIEKGTVKDYIEDGRVKMMVCPLTVLRSINALLTDRVHKNALDPEKGQNFQIQKTGEKRDTKYTVIPRDSMAIPKEFYTEKSMTDPYEIAQALMVNDEYMEAVICKYLYDDVAIPEKKDDYARFPEIKEKLKDKIKDSDEAEEEAPKPARQRPSVAETSFERRAPTQDLTEGDLPWEKPKETPPAEEPRRGRPAGRRRNLVTDLENTK